MAETRRDACNTFGLLSQYTGATGNNGAFDYSNKKKLRIYYTL